MTTHVQTRGAGRLARLATPVGLGLLAVSGLFVGLGQMQSARALPRADLAAQATFVVTNTNDAGAGSLRQAILDANANPGPDLVSIAAVGTIHLASALPAVTDAVTIQGPGAALFSVDGQDQYRVLDIVGAPATLADLTLQHGSAPGVSEDGGAIRSNRALTLTHVVVLSSTAAGDGGGLYISGDLALTGGRFESNRSTGGSGGALRVIGAATVSGTQFVDNVAHGDGGAVFALGGATLTDVLFQGNQCLAASCDGGALFAFSRTTLSGTQIVSNTAGDQGGGVAAPGSAAVIGGLFRDNTSQLGVGGGLYVQGNADVTGTRFVGNSARGDGGGLYAFATLTVTQGLFTNNLSTLGHGGGLAGSGVTLVDGTVFVRNNALEGGGLHHDLFDARIVNALFADNGAANGDGAALRLTSTGSVDVIHVTVAAPALVPGSAIQVLAGTAAITNTVIARHAVGLDASGGLAAQDHNLFFGNGADTQGVVSGGVNSRVGDPVFADPTTDDYRLGPGSAAFDAGTDAGVALDVDGDVRPLGAGFDIGYDEFTPWKLLLAALMR